ncbi:MAG: UTP--glucose-1-phosphate uridylyltransferase GalU [Acidimicrobiales bacterium]
MAPVRKAVIPAAGLGTRFLPATKAQPKEMIPVIDKPSIQFVVEEAVRAGIDDILIITGRGKGSIEDHFDRNVELEAELRAKGKDAELEQIVALTDLANIHFVRQGEPLGLGHAVNVARKHVGDDPFVVLLGDDIMVDSSTVLAEMIAVHERTGSTVLSCKEFPPDQIGLYGCVDPEPAGDRLLRIKGIVEKPEPGTEPSSYAVLGRYVFPASIFDALDRVKPGRGGEIQLTDAIGLLLATEEVLGYTFVDGRYDVGSKLDYLRATVELALARPDLGPDFRAWLASYVREQGIV